VIVWMQISSPRSCAGTSLGDLAALDRSRRQGGARRLGARALGYKAAKEARDADGIASLPQPVSQYRVADEIFRALDDLEHPSGGE
jgi:hypothetical protein